MSFKETNICLVRQPDSTNTLCEPVEHWVTAYDIAPTGLFSTEEDIRNALKYNIGTNLPIRSIFNDVDDVLEHGVSSESLNVLASRFTQMGYATDGVCVYAAVTNPKMALKEISFKDQWYDEDHVLEAMLESIDVAPLHELEVLQTLPKELNAFTTNRSEYLAGKTQSFLDDTIIHLPVLYNEMENTNHSLRTYREGLIIRPEGHTARFNLTVESVNGREFLYQPRVDFLPMTNKGPLLKDQEKIRQFNFDLRGMEPLKTTREIRRHLEHFKLESIIDQCTFAESMKRYEREGYQSIVLSKNGLQPSLEPVPTITRQNIHTKEHQQHLQTNHQTHSFGRGR